MLHNPGFFFQYLEGPDQNVRKVYARVEAARNHQIIMELYNDKVVQRHFSSWHMGFCRSPQGVIQELSHMNWIAKVPTIQEYQNPPLGLQMLIKYWNNMASKAA